MHGRNIVAYDVAVIGGGPAGSATATYLSRSGFSVVVLDATSDLAPRPSETFLPVVNRQLAQLGVAFSSFPHSYRPALGVMSVWGSDEPFVRDFWSGTSGNGCHVDRVAFDRMLAETAINAGVIIRPSSRFLTAPDRSRRSWTFEFRSKEQILACSARFLVDATGRIGSSWLHQLPPRKALDRLTALIWIGKSKVDCPYLTVESVPDGWFYSAAAKRERTTIAYVTDCALWQPHRQRQSGLWLHGLAQTKYSREILPDEVEPLQLRTLPAATVVRSHFAGRDWCAVGDATFSHDPLSGQGVAYALESAAQGASAIVQYFTRGKPLHIYESWVAGKLKNYLLQRRQCYATEQRWRSSPFWDHMLSIS